ncbi:hypothetical protein BLA28_20035 [Eisenbergiella tayi]|nr:hypothetical protein BLA28_20035 [Eisenbergiella tayi]
MNYLKFPPDTELPGEKEPPKSGCLRAGHFYGLSFIYLNHVKIIKDDYIFVQRSFSKDSLHIFLNFTNTTFTNPKKK